MSNPMAQSEPVEQRFGAPAQEAPAAEVATRQIDGTDVIEQGTLAAENVLEALKDVIDPRARHQHRRSRPGLRRRYRS